MYRGRKKTDGCLELKAGLELIANGHKLTMMSDENVLKLHCGDGCTTVEIY